MAEAKKPAPAAEVVEAPKAKKNTILYIVIALLVVVIIAVGGLSVFLFLTLSDKASSGDAAMEETVDKPETSKKKKKSESKKSSEEDKPVYVKLDTYTVNLRGGSSVLQTEIHVQIADEKDKEKITAFLPRISSEVNILLSTKKVEDLSTEEAKRELIAKIKDRINIELGATPNKEGKVEDGMVKDVVFKTFIIQ